MFREPEYLATRQIYSEARTHESLARALRVIDREQAAKTERLGEELLVSLGARRGPELSGYLWTLFYALEGQANDDVVLDDPSHREGVLRALEDMLTRAFEIEAPETSAP